MSANTKMKAAIIILLALTLLGSSQLVQSNPVNYLAYCKSVLVEEQRPRSCLDLLCRGYTSSGVYTIYPSGGDHYSFDVYCDQKTDGGGWTVFQRRMDGSESFLRNWNNYKLGFGNVNGEFWLGNDRLVDLLRTHDANELRVDMESMSNEQAYAQYGEFSVGGEETDYVLSVGSYSGTAGDSMENQNRMKFSTVDRDNDFNNVSCAQRYAGAWWYNNCHQSNLNGLYLNGTHTSFANGINWKTWKGYYESLKTTEMKVRGQFEEGQ